MDGVTDEPFRLVQCKIAKPDLIFTEFVSAEGIAHGAQKSTKVRPLLFIIVDILFSFD